MKQPSIISVGKHENLCWIRCESKGSFLNSSIVKQWVDEQFTSGEKLFVMDLQNCTGMDSTYMGNMVDLAVRANSAGGGLQVVDASEKCVSLLEGLGIASLMDINPSEPDWKDSQDEIRKNLLMIEASGSIDKAQHVYETHKKLCEADSQNQEKFSAVIDCFESENSDLNKKPK